MTNAYLKINKKYLYLVVFIVTFAISLSFAIYTKHAWEDRYTTYRCSKNLAMGNRLVYTVGQRVQAFSSPIRVLIPALLSVVTFNSSDALVLWLFRIIGCCLLGLSAVLLLRIAKEASLRLFPTIFLISMFGININIIDFSINGMETAFMIFFLTCVIYFMTVPSRYPFLNLGLAWAGLMWTRPDGLVYIGGLSIGYLLFNTALFKAFSRRELIKFYIKAGAILVALYLPWFLWAWYYYGSPIPHTAIARVYPRIPNLILTGLTHISSLFHHTIITKDPGNLLLASSTQMFSLLRSLKASAFSLTSYLPSLSSTFMPPYHELGGWGYLASAYSFPLALVCTFYWVLPFAHPRARAASFALMIAHIYLNHIVGVAPWYIPYVTFLTILVFSMVIQQAMALKFLIKDKLNNKNLHSFEVIIYPFACLIVLISLFLTLAASYQLRLQQKIISDGNLKQVGLWLKENATSPKDTVFLEPAGYIGFFSQLKIYDYSGFASPEVVKARKKIKFDDSFAKLILELQPDWLVLVPEEIMQIQNEIPSLLTERYQAIKVFDVSKRLQSYPFIPGRDYVSCEQTLTVFRIKKVSSGHAPSAP